MLRLLTLARDVTAIAFTPDGQHLLAVFHDDAYEHAIGVAWIDPRTGLSEHVAGVVHPAALALVPDGSGFVYAVRPEAVIWGGVLFRVYDAESGRHRQILWNTDRPAITAAVARSTRVFAFSAPLPQSSTRWEVRVWDDVAENLRSVQTTPAESLAVSPDGRWIAVGSLPDRTLEVWDVAANVRVHKLPALPGRLSWPLPDRIVAVSRRELSVWGTASDDPVLMVPDTGVGLLAEDVSPDGRFVAAGAADGVVRVWGMEESEPIASFAWDVGAIRGVAFAPDGLTCAAAGERGRVVLWDFEL